MIKKETLDAVRKAENFICMKLDAWSYVPQAAPKEEQLKALTDDLWFWKMRIEEIYQHIESVIKSVED